MNNNDYLLSGGGKALVFCMTSDIPETVNDLITGGESKNLSAEQGKLLKAEIEYIRRAVAVREEFTATQSGWYRIAHGNRSHCKCCLLQVGQAWIHHGNGGHLVSIMFSNNTGVAQVLNKFGDKTVVDKVRYVYHADDLTSEAWMDIHVNVLVQDHTRVSASSIQDWEFYKAEDWKLVEVAGGYTSNEYDIT